MGTVTASRHQQAMEALQAATAARVAGSAAKADIAAGRLTIPDALCDPRAAPVKIIDLLIAQPRWGRARALKLLTRNYIAESRRVRDLTERQRTILTNACS